MADLSALAINPETIEHADVFSLLPPGIYTVIITGSELKDTRNGKGKYLELQYQIIGGTKTGEVITDRLNIVNQSQKAQAIGLSQLKDVCDAVGHKGQLTASEQLHGKALSIKIEIEKDAYTTQNGEKRDSNNIVKRLPKQAPQMAAQQPQMMQNEPPHPAETATEPW